MSEFRNPPALNAPEAVKWIIGVTVLLHVVRAVVPDDVAQAMMLEMSFIPAFYAVGPESFLAALLLITMPFSYALVHIDVTHLAVNMLLFLAFGAAIGRRMGFGTFVVFYALSAATGALVFGLFNAEEFAQVVGASGAVAGMVGAVGRLSLRPETAWRDLANPMPFHSRNAALGFIVVWLVLNFAFGVIPPSLVGSDAGGIAWETHLGGFAFGFLAIRWFDGRGLPPDPFEFDPPAHT